MQKHNSNRLQMNRLLNLDEIWSGLCTKNCTTLQSFAEPPRIPTFVSAARPHLFLDIRVRQRHNRRTRLDGPRRGPREFPCRAKSIPFLEIFRAEPLGDTNHANHIVLIRRLSDCCSIFLAAGMGETAAAKSSAPAPGNPIASNPLKIAQLAWYKANTTTTFAVGNEPNVGVVDFRGGLR
ncbi:MAG TPA: hypothetical protein VND65_07685 [Candidatus Binatia bacterium]|nr:hypothetical protein [Candidatus Binatia bacterium]